MPLSGPAMPFRPQIPSKCPQEERLGHSYWESPVLHGTKLSTKFSVALESPGTKLWIPKRRVAFPVPEPPLCILWCNC